MTSFAPESGKGGKVLISTNSIGEVGKWTFRKQVEEDSWASSETGGFKMDTPGVKSGDGTINFKLDSSAAFPALEGAQVTLLLYVDSTNFYSVPATMREVQIEVDIDGGKVITGTANFKTNGQWTEPSW